MTQKLFCLCAAAALLFVFATANVASAQEAAHPAGCPCALTAAPCPFVVPGCPPALTYRIGPFGAIRPVVYAPVYRPPVVRPVYVPPRYFRAVACPPPIVACPPYYAW